MQIFVFGDSICYGAWDETGGWVERLKGDIHKKIIATYKENSDYYFQIYNLGISGNTSEDLVKRFEGDISPRLNIEQENMIIFAIGVNDSILDSNTNRNWVNMEKYRENLDNLLRMAKKYSERIFFLGLTEVDEERVNPISWQPWLAYTQELVGQYDLVLKNFCQENEITYIEVPPLTEDMLEDGIHPNSEGHRLIFEKVEEAISPNLE